jgi:hypothetical protein
MRYLLFTIAAFCSIEIFAQQATVTSGGNATGTGGSFSYSIGQVCNASNNEGTILEGVQQPYEIYAVSVEESLFELELNLYPNPTTNELTIEIPNFKAGLTATIYDSKGLLLDSVKLSSSRTSISANHWAASTYYIHVAGESGNSAKYKLIKN